MKVLDVTRLEAGQVELLALVLQVLTRDLPEACVAMRMRLSNLKHKEGKDMRDLADFLPRGFHKGVPSRMAGAAENFQV